MEVNGLVSSSQLQEMMARTWGVEGVWILKQVQVSLTSWQRNPRRLKAVSVTSLALTGLVSTSVSISGSQNGPSRCVPPRQVLPVLRLGSGFSVAGPCCSHSGPSGSHWPCEGPFSSWLDRRAASPPSEICTQRCLCQPCSQGGSDGHITTKH